MNLWSCFLLLLLIEIVRCSKHQGRRKSKVSKSKQNPTRTHATVPLSQVEIQTVNQGTSKPANSTSSHLRSALDVLAPENDIKSNSEYESPLLMKTVTEKLHSEMPRSSGAMRNANSSRNDVVFEVINMDPYTSFKSRFNKRFFILIGLYVASGLIGIVAIYCIARIIVTRRRRHKQYMLLTKSDMDYHKGGGGI